MEDRLPRKLAAILYADVAGYSRLTGEDEEGTHRRLSQYLDHISGEIKHHQGRVVHYAGDAVLADFTTATGALACAVSIQEELVTRNQDLPKRNKVEFRIGINLGEVIVDRDDIYGDGVNVAARLENLAHPGEICISESVKTAIGKKLSVGYRYLGEQQVKNIAEPVRAYHVLTAPDQSSHSVPHSKEVTRSVAVLPFINMSGDQEQDYFADGLTEDIITSLSLWRSFPVLSRNSTFTYKNSNIQPQQIAEELGARYILEGSVRKSGNRVRITAELIDGETGHNLWAQNFDRDLEDIFAVQDELTHRISATVVPEFEHTETKRSVRKPPNNLDAWDYYLRGLSFVHKSTKDGNAQAHEMFRKALELESDYGPALSGIAYVLNRDLLLDNVESFEKTANECLEAAKRAVDLDESAAISRTELVRALLWCGQHDAAIQEATRAIELNPANALVMGWLGAALCFTGREEEGIPRLEDAIELAPRDPRNNFFMTHLAVAYLTTGELEKALNSARSAVQGQTDFIEAPTVLASILGHLDKKEEAQTILNQFGIKSISSIENRPFWRRYLYAKPKDLVVEGLRKADLDAYKTQVETSVSLQQPGKPSIAVLPFTNMSGDPEQEYFSDGITEDIITELSRFRSFIVIARTSSFAYREKNITAREIAGELKVRFVVEGSVRRSGDRVRITAQLIDGTRDDHLWAERFDGNLEDVFEFQDEVVARIAGAIAGSIDAADLARAERTTPDDMRAYDYFLRGQAMIYRSGVGDMVRAREMLAKALELDQNYARAHANMALSYCVDIALKGYEDLEQWTNLAVKHAETAYRLDRNDSLCQWAMSETALFQCEFDRSRQHIDRAIELNPNDADILAWACMVYVSVGQPQKGIELVDRAIVRNPFHPDWYFWLRGFACCAAGLYEEAIENTDRIGAPNIGVLRVRAVALAKVGRLDDAHAIVDRILEIEPSFSIADVPRAFKEQVDFDRWLDGLRRAGLPD